MEFLIVLAKPLVVVRVICMVPRSPRQVCNSIILWPELFTGVWLALFERLRIAKLFMNGSKTWMNFFLLLFALCSSVNGLESFVVFIVLCSTPKNIFPSGPYCRPRPICHVSPLENIPISWPFFLLICTTHTPSGPQPQNPMALRLLIWLR